MKIFHAGAKLYAGADEKHDVIFIGLISSVRIYQIIKVC